MIYEINHVGIRNRDMERTLAFYEALDAVVVYDAMIPGPEIRIVYLQLGDGLIEFIGPSAEERNAPAQPGSASDTGYGINHLAFLTDDIDTDHARLVAAGALEAVAPKPAGTGVGRISFVQLGDARLELLERDLEMRRPLPGQSIIRGLDHYSLTTDDFAGTLEFLRAVLGLEPRGGIDVGEQQIRRYLGLSSDAVGVGPAGTAIGPGAFPSFTLRVEDVDVALSALAQRGLTGLAPATDSPLDSGRCALLEDPDGVLIELLDNSPITAGAESPIVHLPGRAGPR